MERTGLVRYTFLSLAVILYGCTGNLIQEDYAEVTISFEKQGFTTKALDPDENLVSDISLLVYDSNGLLEESIWCRKEDLTAGISMNLLCGKDYRFLACVNFGYRVASPDIDDVLEQRFYLAYPDEYKEGIPMTADSGMIYIDKDSQKITPNLLICAKPGQIRHTKLPFKCYYIHMIVSKGTLYDTLMSIPNYIY